MENTFWAVSAKCKKWALIQVITNTEGQEVDAKQLAEVRQAETFEVRLTPDGKPEKFQTLKLAKQYCHRQYGIVK